jgi:hypothetical protein
VQCKKSFLHCKKISETLTPPGEKFFEGSLEIESRCAKSVRRQVPVPGLLRGFPLVIDPCRFSKDVAMQTENRKDFDLDRLLHPAGAFRTPMEVVNDPDMTVQEKRAILASWASDACAVEASPDLRQPPAAPIVRFDDIMDALKRLDGEAADKPTYGKFINRARRWKDLYRSDWQDRKFETYLPRVNTTVPWLEIDTKTRLPKGDIPLGRDVASVGRFVLPSRVDVQVSTNSFSSSGSM